MTNESQDGLDLILDAALREYSNREPRAGFERRILGRMQSTPPMRSLWWLVWALVPVSLAAITLVVITADHGHPTVQPQRQVVRVTQLPAPPPIPTIATIATRPAKLHNPERVPEPETLTAGERALLRFAQSDPEQARELFADSGQMKDLTIDPLKIEALP